MHLSVSYSPSSLSWFEKGLTLNCIPLHAVLWGHLTEALLDDLRIAAALQAALVGGHADIFLAMEFELGIYAGGSALGRADYCG